MYVGKEASLRRRAEVAMHNRKNGIHAVAIVTVARAELANQWPDLIHHLPHASTERIQNDDGSFPYLPGWDGPIGP